MNKNPVSKLANHGASHAKYRADIDGLRALAVISVVFYHAFPEILGGGFVGVDIFFVISGFLISTIIMTEVQHDNFSFTRFYSRRIKRIFPALLLVMIFCLIFGWFVLLSDEYKQLGKHVVGGAGFLSNIIFWHESGYFDTASDTKILLHLWSLGIEEQFYFLWPALVWATWRRNFNFIVICVLLLVVSFVCNIHTVKMDAVAAFYSPLSRFWELFAGSVLAYFVMIDSFKLIKNESRIPLWMQRILLYLQHGILNSVLRNVAAIVGIFLLVLAEIFVVSSVQFPGWWALLPTIGAYLIISAGPQSWFNRYILSNRILVWFGLISYPLYLWHWPLLAFVRHLEDQALSLHIRIIVVLASITLAWLTYWLIEKPIRFGKHNSYKIVVLCSIMISVGGVGYYIYHHNGLGFRMKDRSEYDAYFEGYFHDLSKFVEERDAIGQNQCNRYDYLSHWGNNKPRPSISPECYTRHSQKSILLWGDSHAAHLYYGLKKVLSKDISTLLVFSSACRPRLSNAANIQLDHCEMSNHFALNLVKKQTPDIVMLASSSSFDINQIRELAHQLKLSGVKKVYVLGELPHWKPFLYKIVIKRYWYNTPKRILGHQNEEMLAWDKEFRSKLKVNEEFEYVDLFNFFCNAKGCMTYLGDNRRENLITLDDSHLRPFASTYLAKNFLAPLIQKQIEQ